MEGGAGRNPPSNPQETGRGVSQTGGLRDGLEPEPDTILTSTSHLYNILDTVANKGKHPGNRIHQNKTSMSSEPSPQADSIGKWSHNFHGNGIQTRRRFRHNGVHSVSSNEPAESESSPKNVGNQRANLGLMDGHSEGNGCVIENHDQPNGVW